MILKDSFSVVHHNLLSNEFAKPNNGITAEFRQNLTLLGGDDRQIPSHAFHPRNVLENAIEFLQTTIGGM